MPRALEPVLHDDSRTPRHVFLRPVPSVPRSHSSNDYYGESWASNTLTDFRKQLGLAGSDSSETCLVHPAVQGLCGARGELSRAVERSTWRVGAAQHVPGWFRSCVASGMPWPSLHSGTHTFIRSRRTVYIHTARCSLFERQG